MPGTTFALNVLKGVLGHGVEVEIRDRNLQDGFLVKQTVLVGLAISLPKNRANSAVIARQGLVGVAGNAVRHDLRVENANETVTLYDVGIEKSERFAGLDGFHPQRGLAQFDA